MPEKPPEPFPPQAVNITQAVRKTLHGFVQPGWREDGIARKYCLIDGKATYRILKVYGLLL